MGFRIQETGEYIATDFGLREYFKGKFKVPNPLTVDWLEMHGVDSVFEGPQASGGTVYQYSQFAGIEQASDGKWYTKYVLGPVFTDTTAEDGTITTAAQHEAEYKAMKDAEQARLVRHTRTENLNASDWTQLADSPVDKAVWATYRQALRDITAQTGFPWNVTWPDQP